MDFLGGRGKWPFNVMHGLRPPHEIRQLIVPEKEGRLALIFPRYFQNEDVMLFRSVSFLNSVNLDSLNPPVTFERVSFGDEREKFSGFSVCPFFAGSVSVIRAAIVIRVITKPHCEIVDEKVDLESR